MLVLTRRLGESIKIKPHATLDPNTPVGSLFGRSRRPASRDTCTSMYIAEGPIEVMVMKINGAQVKLGIEADARFIILRDELEEY